MHFSIMANRTETTRSCNLKLRTTLLKNADTGFSSTFSN